MQKVDGSTLYDSFEVSFNAVDKASILKINNIDILQSMNNKASINDVYNKTDIDIGLHFKADKFNTHLKTDVDVFVSILQSVIYRRVLINAVDITGQFKINATAHDILQIQKNDDSTLYDALELSFNIVDKTNILKNIIIILIH